MSTFRSVRNPQSSTSDRQEKHLTGLAEKFRSIPQILLRGAPIMFNDVSRMYMGR